jgi:hypothetical protein
VREIILVESRKQAVDLRPVNGLVHWHQETRRRFGTTKLDRANVGIKAERVVVADCGEKVRRGQARRKYWQWQSLGSASMETCKSDQEIRPEGEMSRGQRLGTERWYLAFQICSSFFGLLVTVCRQRRIVWGCGGRGPVELHAVDSFAMTHNPNTRWSRIHGKTASDELCFKTDDAVVPQTSRAPAEASSNYLKTCKQGQEERK